MSHFVKTGAVLSALALALCLMPMQAAAADSGSTEATVSFTGGELKLQRVPVLDFGSHDIVGAEQSYEAQSISEPIQVSDLRGTGAGWDLTVSLSPFTLTDSGAQTLQGAKLVITNPVIAPESATPGTPPQAPQTTELTTDDTVTPIFSAEKDAGMGVWNLAWQAPNTTLVVRQGTARVGSSAATLTWSLQSAP